VNGKKLFLLIGLIFSAKPFNPKLGVALLLSCSFASPVLSRPSQPEPRLIAQAEIAQFSLPRFQFPGFPGSPRVFAITPERRALLNTIRYAEGTWKEGADLGYRVMFGGSLMDSLERHPDRVNYTKGYASAAAGAYQFMPATWALVVRAMGLAGFNPQVQDQAALFLIQKRGALQLADQGALTAELAAKLAPEWASFPTLRGSSYYGQPVKRLTELQRFYEANLARLQGRVPMAKTVPHDHGTCNDNSLDCALKNF
jgi:lysozyme